MLTIEAFVRNIDCLPAFLDCQGGCRTPCDGDASRGYEIGR
jgi:hypothetical protein